MAKASQRATRAQRVLFARIGWMHFYNGPVPGDEKPIGGGQYNKTEIGHEVYNFRTTDGRLYGYFQPTMTAHSIALERIDPDAADEDSLDGVLVVFVARRPEGGQVIVGWYRDAEVERDEIKRSPGKPRTFGHFVSADRRNCVLLPEDRRQFEIPRDGGIGRANVCYALEADGSHKAGAKHKWIDDALEFVAEYDGSNILDTPEADAEAESANAAETSLARSQGQGFARSAEERRAIEKQAMKVATAHFRDQGYAVEDVSARRSYDLLCERNGRELHVEVKGTTTNGSAVVLTYNEVKHARDPASSCALFVLHSIKLDRKKATGGQSRVLLPWELEQHQLTPICYTYRL
ncbi:MAG: DUF3883 domain-containing protein [Enhydrobacter sp.]|nr:MAG: DUF3883 domain-containing protein [Enhydrobacter sp.]